jgi:hypothetical protein
MTDSPFPKKTIFTLPSLKTFKQKTPTWINILFVLIFVLGNTAIHQFVLVNKPDWMLNYNLIVLVLQLTANAMTYMGYDIPSDIFNAVAQVDIQEEKALVNDFSEPEISRDQYLIDLKARIKTMTRSDSTNKKLSPELIQAIKDEYHTKYPNDLKMVLTSQGRVLFLGIGGKFQAI